MERLGDYLGGLCEAWLESGPLAYVMAAIWLLQPVAFVTVVHPSDAVGFQLWLQGFVVPDFMSGRALSAGEATALMAMAALFLLELGTVTLIYRRLQGFIQFWPLAAFLVAFLANGIWWLSKGYFDIGGAMAGCMPIATAAGCLFVCERLGGNFVFGPGPKPSFY